MFDRDSSRVAGDHPDEAETASYLEGTLDRAALDRVEAHLAACAECRAGVALLALDSGSGRGPIPENELAPFRKAALARNRPRRTRAATTWLMAAAAVLVAAAGLAFWLAPRGSGDASLLERDPDPAALRALSPSAGTVVRAQDLEFRFAPVEGADRYVVTVVDGDGRLVASIESRAADGPVAWPGDRPVPRGTLLWSVRATRLGRALAETRPVAFECR